MAAPLLFEIDQMCTDDNLIRVWTFLPIKIANEIISYYPGKFTQ